MRQLGLLLLFMVSFYGVASLNAEQEGAPLITDTRIRIAVVETGLNKTPEIEPYICKTGSISFVDNNPFSDEQGHGTNVTGLIAKSIDPKKYCIVMIKYWSPTITSLGYEFNQVVMSILYATSIHAKYLNLSLGGSEPIESERLALIRALKTGMKIAVASGNNSGFAPLLNVFGDPVLARDLKGELITKKNSKGAEECVTVKQKKICKYEPMMVPSGQDLDKQCFYFPACYGFTNPNFHVVGSYTGQPNGLGNVHIYANFGKIVRYSEDGTSQGSPSMTGTSQATAIHLGKWVKQDTK